MNSRGQQRLPGETISSESNSACCLIRECPSEEGVNLYSLATHGPPCTNVKTSGDGFGKARSGFRCSNTHTHTRCSPVTLDFPIVPFSATVLSSTSRARRIFLQAPRSQLMEEVAPLGVFLSFSRILAVKLYLRWSVKGRKCGH